MATVAQHAGLRIGELTCLLCGRSQTTRVGLAKGRWAALPDAACLNCGASLGAATVENQRLGDASDLTKREQFHKSPAPVEVPEPGPEPEDDVAPRVVDMPRQGCRYLKQSERLRRWQQFHGPLPAGKLLGSTCSLRYCNNPDHFLLVDDRTTAQINWSDHAKRIQEIGVGQSVELEIPTTQQKFASAMRSRLWDLRLSIVTVSAGHVRVTRLEPEPPAWKTEMAQAESAEAESIAALVNREAGAPVTAAGSDELMLREAEQPPAPPVGPDEHLARALRWAPWCALIAQGGIETYGDAKFAEDLHDTLLQELCEDMSVLSRWSVEAFRAWQEVDRAASALYEIGKRLKADAGSEATA